MDMKIQRKNARMRWKVLALCLALALSALILQTALYLRTSSKLIYQEAKEESLRLMQNMQNEIESYARSVETGLLRLYNESDFIADLRREAPIDGMREAWNRLAFRTGSENFDTSLGVLALYLYTKDHEIISTYRKAMTPRHTYPADIYDGTQDTNAQIVKDYVASDDSVMLISSYYNKYRQRQIVRFVVKLYQNRRLVGYAVCDADEKVLQRIMKKYTAGGKNYVWVQPDGDIPITSTGELTEADLSYYERVSEGIQSRSPDETEERGEVSGAQTEEESAPEAVSEDSMIGAGDRVFFRVDQDRYNLGSYALMSRDLLEKNQRTLNRCLLLIGIVVSAAAVILSFPLSHSLTRKLERMTVTMKRIEGGETKLRMTPLPDDEIGELGRAFNELLDQIEGLIASEYEAKLMINRAEYMALQAQINPHFLYNTLDTMSSIAELQDCMGISALCQSLSGIFRYSLDMKNPFSTVAKEIAHLKNYIYVMNVRMQGEVSYEFEIEDDILQDTLPRISIQPLVENALSHGLKNARGDKKVRILAYKEQDNLKIAVEDNGVGISKDRLEELLRNPSGQGKSIGLANIHSRMQMLYGADYGVKVESEEGKGTRVFLTIPRRKMEEALWKAENIRS